MRLKYYLRGAGVGIIVTTVILMTAFSSYVSDLKAQQDQPIAGETVAQANTEALKKAAETETETENPAEQTSEGNNVDSEQTAEEKNAAAEQGKDSDAEQTTEGNNAASEQAAESGAASAGTKPEDGTKTENATTMQDSESRLTGATEADANAPGSSTQDNAEPAEENAPDAANASAATERIVLLDIAQGEPAADVAKKMERVGLVDSASEFKKYMIENGVDVKLKPGAYEMKIGATYEELCAVFLK